VDDGACWCADVELDDAARARLAAAGDDCLCPACLAEVNGSIEGKVQA
jgi:hypothetical protein